ncbi:MAG TPA: NAD(P)-dependent oxidoreductase [Chloroflexota bacterium]
MPTLVVIAPIGERDLAQIRAVSDAVEVVMAWEAFLPELRAQYSPWTLANYPSGSAEVGLEDAEAAAARDALLARAEMLLLAWPPPQVLRRRAPHLRWVHQLQAGVSNLRPSDVWGADVLTTSGRGAVSPQPLAEWVVGALLALAKDFPQAVARQQEELTRRDLAPIQVAGKTIGIIGLGGIGARVATLCAALGLTVWAARRDVAAGAPSEVARLFGPDQIAAMVAGCDFVAVCAQVPADGRPLVGAAELAVMRPGAFLLNVARGDLVDEAALIAALASGRLGGAALDVHLHEFEGPFPPALRALPNVLLTPHTAGQSDVPSRERLDLFCDNLRRYLAGAPLENVVDWARGY